MFKPTPTWPNFDFGQFFICQIGVSFEKKVHEVGQTKLIRFYIALNWGENGKLGRYIFKVADFGDIAWCSKESLISMMGYKDGGGAFR